MEQNNGYIAYTLLVQYSSLTGAPTGLQKPNIPSDPDYIAPVYNPTLCPPILPDEMTIVVVIPTNFAATIKMYHGGAIDQRTTSGNWVLPKRIYDSIVFIVTSIPPVYFQYKITYNGGLVRLSNQLTFGSSYLAAGPFDKITKIELIHVNSGDFADDFNNDFNN